MALRDKVVVTMASTVPAKQREHVVSVTSPGGTIAYETFGDTHFKIVERTRKGREKRALLLSREHVISIEVIQA